MKQKIPTKPKPLPSWANKLTRKGLEFLEGYRLAGKAIKQFEPDAAKKFIEFLPKLLPGFAQNQQKVTLSPELLESLKTAGMPFDEVKAGAHVMPENTARFFKNAQTIKDWMADPELRKEFPPLAALLFACVQDTYTEIAVHSFGTRELSVDQMFWTAGATLEAIGKMIRHEPFDLGKGRVNVELLELVRTIRSNQTKKLTPKELQQALEYAGYFVADEEALRLFEWRSKKKGQL